MAFKKSIRSHAAVGVRGVSGSVGVAICALPLIVSTIFGVFAYFAILDSDPGDKMAGYVVAGLSGVTLLVFIHYVSFRIVITADAIYSGSLILGERVIHLNEPFVLGHTEDEQQLSLKQTRTRIKIGWILNGFEDLRQLVHEAHEKQKNRVNSMTLPRKPSE